MPSEQDLRDHLAMHLDLIESGLKLVDIEFKLPNLRGAKGFIDILAWDRIGHLVVIEIKISNNSARTALHELHKYVALLRQLHGIPVHKLRCLVLSTEWCYVACPEAVKSRARCTAVGRS